MQTNSITIDALQGLPEIRSGDDLGQLLAKALEPMKPTNNDIVVVAQKIVSKSEGRVCRLSDIVVSDHARELAAKTNKNPKIVELILQESNSIVKAWEGTIIVEDKRGLVMANAGIDESNAGADGEVILLPRDPDKSAQKLQSELSQTLDANLGVIISDSFGRPWRRGVMGVAIGASGFGVLQDARGSVDRRGRRLASTEIAIADAIAAAAVLIMGEANEGIPAALVRGWAKDGEFGGASILQRPPSMDKFR